MQNEAEQTLIEFCQENALVIANTLFQQHKRRLYTWTSPDDQDQNQIDYILCSQRWRSSIQSTKQDQELYKKDLHDPDNHDGVIINLEPDISESEVRGALDASLRTKPVEVMEFQLSCFKS